MSCAICGDDLVHARLPALYTLVCGEACLKAACKANRYPIELAADVSTPATRPVDVSEILDNPDK